jgi:3-oxoacyl-[acyl-carrier-protein] synthase II
MNLKITGFGSVTPFGALTGLIPLERLNNHLEPTPITLWLTDGLRRAFQVQSFQPSSVVPGLKTRRLDRISTWALVAASLALKDAGLDLNQIDLSQIDRTRVAVVYATGSGCIELTESFYRSAAANGWAGTDPITFPETLANSPAGHIAMHHKLQGPNITISGRFFAAESALLQAASLLRNNQADLAIVLAGDALAQTLYEWYETAHMLAPACFNAQACFNEDPLAANCGFIPGEGLVALVLQSENTPITRAYAHLQTGSWTAGGTPHNVVSAMLKGTHPSLAICAGNAAPCDTGQTAQLIAELAGAAATLIPAVPVASGLSDAGGLLHLLLALSSRPHSGKALMLATSEKNGYATLLLDIPQAK